MKSNKNTRGEIFILFLLVSLFFLAFMLLLRDIAENSIRVENPSKELIDKVERKYLNENFIDDFKVDDSIFKKPTIGGEGDCDIYWKNSQNIKFSEREVYFNDEVIINIGDLSEYNRKRFRNLVEREKRKCFLNRKQEKINRELNLVR